MSVLNLVFKWHICTACLSVRQLYPTIFSQLGEVSGSVQNNACSSPSLPAVSSPSAHQLSLQHNPISAIKFSPQSAGLRTPNKSRLGPSPTDGTSTTHSEVVPLSFTSSCNLLVLSLSGSAITNNLLHRVPNRE